MVDENVIAVKAHSAGVVALDGTVIGMPAGAEDHAAALGEVGCISENETSQRDIPHVGEIIILLERGERVFADAAFDIGIARVHASGQPESEGVKLPVDVEGSGGKIVVVHHLAQGMSLEENLLGTADGRGVAVIANGGAVGVVIDDEIVGPVGKIGAGAGNDRRPNRQRIGGGDDGRSLFLGGESDRLSLRAGVGEEDRFAINARGDEDGVAGLGPLGGAGDGLERMGCIAGRGVVAGGADINHVGEAANRGDQKNRDDPTPSQGAFSCAARLSSTLRLRPEGSSPKSLGVLAVDIFEKFTGKASEG